MRIPRMVFFGLLCIGALLACEREERQFRELPAATERASGHRISDLVPGPVTPDAAVRDPYAANAYGLQEGQRLYEWMNCVGCHFHGGGGIGPPLMDNKWIYGSDPEDIFATIVEGRPNGMPSYRGKLTDNQIWMIVAYVRSLSAMTTQAAMPGRSDHMSAKKEGVPQMPEPPQRQPGRQP
jgi:cytochrome c oxidase cbb3-type subunit III